VVALVDTSGAVQERFTYTSYGAATGLNPNFTAYSGSTNFQWTTLFAGRDVDASTGLYYNNARWYNPSLGVFVATDPVAADPNTYRYAANNPVTRTDPTGEYPAHGWYWDPDRNEIVDDFSGMTFEEVMAADAAQLAQWRAGIAPNTAGHTNKFVPEDPEEIEPPDEKTRQRLTDDHNQQKKDILQRGGPTPEETQEQLKGIKKAYPDQAAHKTEQQDEEALKKAAGTARNIAVGVGTIYLVWLVAKQVIAIGGAPFSGGQSLWLELEPL